MCAKTHEKRPRRDYRRRNHRLGCRIGFEGRGAHILPETYVVDGKTIASPGYAAKMAALKEPRELRVTACPMMLTKRIKDFMPEIGRVRSGHVTLNTFEPGGATVSEVSGMRSNNALVSDACAARAARLLQRAKTRTLASHKQYLRANQRPDGQRGVVEVTTDGSGLESTRSRSSAEPTALTALLFFVAARSQPKMLRLIWALFRMFCPGCGGCGGRSVSPLTLQSPARYSRKPGAIWILSRSPTPWAIANGPRLP